MAYVSHTFDKSTTRYSCRCPNNSQDSCIDHGLDPCIKLNKAAPDPFNVNRWKPFLIHLLDSEFRALATYLSARSESVTKNSAIDTPEQQIEIIARSKKAQWGTPPYIDVSVSEQPKGYPGIMVSHTLNEPVGSFAPRSIQDLGRTPSRRKLLRKKQRPTLRFHIRKLGKSVLHRGDPDAKPALPKGPAVILCPDEPGARMLSWRIEDLEEIQHVVDSKEILVTFENQIKWHMTFSEVKDAAAVADHIVRFIFAPRGLRRS